MNSTLPSLLKINRHYYYLFICSILVLIVFMALAVVMNRYYDKKGKLYEVAEIELIDYQSNNRINIKQLAEQQQQALIIVYFHPDCDLCAIEARHFLDNSAAFENVTSFFITSADQNKIKAFLQDYSIETIKNSHILIDSDFTFALTYDIPSPPALIVYDRSGRLVTLKKGFTDPETIKGILKSFNH